jgi:hypothetical protein
MGTAVKLFVLNGYEVFNAAFQPAKKGVERSIQVRKNNQVVKNIRYKCTEDLGLAKASRKAKEWIKQQPFDFWKNNRNDQHHQKTIEELIQLFKEWLPKIEKNWLEYYSSDRVIRAFLATDDEGLRSVFEEKQYPSILDHLHPVLMQFLYPKKAV